MIYVSRSKVLDVENYSISIDSYFLLDFLNNCSLNENRLRLYLYFFLALIIMNVPLILIYY